MGKTHFCDTGESQIVILFDVVAGINCSELRHQFSLGRPNGLGYVMMQKFKSHSLYQKYTSVDFHFNILIIIITLQAVSKGLSLGQRIKMCKTVIQMADIMHTHSTLYMHCRYC